jgi:catechol 2,3-dioxygenase-like lactoylglutathione lyase family enzyme
VAEHLPLVALVVREYDEAIRFFVDALGFDLLEDTDQGLTGTGKPKRWVVVAPAGSVDRGASLLLAEADGLEQLAAVGTHAGGRVGLFLHTDDFAAQHARMVAAGVHFREEPRHEPYGTVAVFEDLYGNPWDLIQPA